VKDMITAMQCCCWWALCFQRLPTTGPLLPPFTTLLIASWVVD